MTVVWHAADRPGRARLCWAGPTPELPRDLAARAHPVPALRLSPPLTDHHVHGGAGTDLATSAVEDVAAWLTARREAGVADVIGSLPALPPDDLAAALDRLRPLWADGALAGVHLEGPFLSPRRAGAHAPTALCTPGSPAGQRVRHILREQPRGFVRTLTLAPELPGTAELLRELAPVGVLPCPGHTDADHAAITRFLDQAGALLPAGATPVVTHLFNAMRPFHHRDPGPVPALLAAARNGQVRLELIVDGVHVDPAVVDLVLRDPALAARAVLVSDAVASTGAAAGTVHRLGPARVWTDGSAALLGAPEDAADTLAGGALPLEAAVGTLLRRGLPPDAVLHAATRTPGETLAVDPGRPASTDRPAVLVWTDDGRVTVLWQEG